MRAGCGLTSAGRLVAANAGCPGSDLLLRVVLALTPAAGLCSPQLAHNTPIFAHAGGWDNQPYTFLLLENNVDKNRRPYSFLDATRIWFPLIQRLATLTSFLTFLFKTIFGPTVYTATVLPLLASFSPSVSVVASVQGCDVIDQHVGQGIPAPIVTTVAHPKGAQRIWTHDATMPRFHTGA